MSSPTRAAPTCPGGQINSSSAVSTVLFPRGIMTSLVASLYPRLPDRAPLPFYHAPACLVLSILPFLFRNKTLISTLTFPLLLYICITWPYYTTGDPSNDYYNGNQFIAVPLWYLDFVFLTPRDGHGSPAFLGDKAVEGKQKLDPTRWKDLSTFWQRARWALRLMVPAQRGIGWNWQVKGVPADRDASLPKWRYVRSKASWALFYYLQSVIALTALGLGVSWRERYTAGNGVEGFVANAIVGWAGALWVWDRLCCAYSLAAAAGVAVGMTDTWEWPPLMGPLRDAWSVRQMWSATYHQAFRRLLSQPSSRITRLLRLPKGSRASGYTQLFLTFTLSCLFHKAQMFNVARKDMGELAFFMSQPLAIIAETAAAWLWTRTGLAGRHAGLERFVGRAWTFAWFSFSLRMYIGGLVEARVMKDWFFAYAPLEVGHQVLVWCLSK